MREVAKLIQTSQGPGTEKYRVLGTPSNVLDMNKIGVLPTRNFSETVFEHAEEVSGEYMHDHFTARPWAAPAAPSPASSGQRSKTAPTRAPIVGLDYESLFALGPNCGIDYLPAIINLSANVRRLGNGHDEHRRGHRLGDGMLRAGHAEQRRVRRPGPQLRQRR